MTLSAPRIVVAGLSGDAGKTLVSLSILSGARGRGLETRAFKKGPDYIDAAWLSWASGNAARNLDTFLSGPDEARAAFAGHAVRAGAGGAAALNLVEGNRGLFDGMDAVGTHSTASLAKLLHAPVVLVLDVRKTTGTAAALVRGCQALDPDLAIAGVVLNRVAGKRHEAIVREAVEGACGVPVVGAIPRQDDERLVPGRHMGLVTPGEHGEIGRVAESLARIAREHIDLDRMIEIAGAAPGQVGDGAADQGGLVAKSAAGADRVTVGYLADSAFSFYYPENLEALESKGAVLRRISSLVGEPLPGDLDALYAGGGFPETHAAALEGNRGLLDSLRRAATAGLPIYAECGGLMLLARGLTWRGRRHVMAGVLPVEVEVLDSPQGHGYMTLSVDRPNPFFAAGRQIRAHEFHYSRIVGPLPATACAVVRGTGCGAGRDAIVVNQVWASYAHVHAAGTPEWAEGLVAAARRHRSRAR